VPSDEIASRVLFGKTLAFPMSSLHLKYFFALDVRSAQSDLQTVVHLSQHSQHPVQWGRKINSHTPTRLVPRQLISRWNAPSVANFLSQTVE
jgi:hypothetical protein